MEREREREREGRREYYFSAAQREISPPLCNLFIFSLIDDFYCVAVT